MPLKIIGVVLVAALCVAGAWALKRPASERTATASTAPAIDCYRGVTCPILWHPRNEQR